MTDTTDIGRVASPNRLSSSTEPQERLGPAGFDPARMDDISHRHRHYLQMLEPNARYPFVALPAERRVEMVRDGVIRVLLDDLRQNCFGLTAFGLAAKGVPLTCPFCRSAQVCADSRYIGEERVFCTNCGTQGPVSSDRTRAVYLWNDAPRDSDRNPEGQDAQRLGAKHESAGRQASPNTSRETDQHG